MIDLRPDQFALVKAILAAEVPDYEVWAFGSRARWTATDSSDLDLAIVSERPLPFSRLSKLRQAFEQSYLPFKVDVVDLARVSPDFREVIEKQRIVISELHNVFADRSGSAGRRSLPLEDAIETIIDYRGKTPKKVDSGIPLITAKIVKNGTIENPTEFISPDDYQGWMRRGFPRTGDVLLTTEAPLGQVAQLDTDRVALAQRVVALRGKKDVLDNTFFKYLLQSSDVQDQLKSRASGTTVLGIKQSELRKINLALPTMDEQRAIAHILGTLDDKIELNRRMNETLEAIARALFKSWFIDFDPVRAKAEGRDPRLHKHLVHLFPDSFEDSELGQIPNRWSVMPFSETVEIIGGGTPKTSNAEYWNGEVPWFSVVDAPSEADLWVVDTEKKITEPGIENSATRLLPVGTTIITARGTVGRMALVGVPMAMNQSCYGLRGREDSRDFFTYFTTRELVERLQQHAHGSVFDTITRETFTRIFVLVPPSELVTEFEVRITPTMERVRAAVFESNNLKVLRDTLLPKLISGELRVKDAGRFVERVIA
jgi:type I restriction enzyme S subunit